MSEVFLAVLFAFALRGQYRVWHREPRALARFERSYESGSAFHRRLLSAALPSCVCGVFLVSSAPLYYVVGGRVGVALFFSSGAVGMAGFLLACWVFIVGSPQRLMPPHLRARRSTEASAVQPQVDGAAIKAGALEASGGSWTLSDDDDGVPIVRVRAHGHADRILTLTRDQMPASLADVRFVAHSRDDIEVLLNALRGDATNTGVLDEIEARLSAASVGPWTSIPEGPGSTGCSVIWVADGSEPDLYLWLDGVIAPDADYDYVAATRQDIPVLLAAVRESLGQGPRRNKTERERP